MGDDLQKKSLYLYDVLEAVGACENIRWKFKDNATTYEICDTLALCHTNEHSSVYAFGSQSEGSTTLGLRSDADYLFANETTPVIESIEDSSQFVKSFVIVTDETTKPGYAKLQMVHNGVPQKVYSSSRGMFYLDHEGRICVKHFSTIGLDSKFQERNGPAYTIPESHGFKEIDFIYANRCRTIPRTANTWIDKERPYNWPSRDQVKKMSTFGCFFVQKGHPKSNRPYIEWRMSFSLQERHLMQGLNLTQHKCYIFLKMIKKDIIHPRAGESISSYHCKTCLFYTIGNTETRFWIPNNLIQATILCMIRLLQWTDEKNCPNFFVPDENMFDRLKHETLRQVAVVLEDILSSGIEFISWIKCDNVGALFINTSISRSALEDVKSVNKVKLYNHLYINNVGYIYEQRNIFLSRRIPSIKSPEECLDELVKLLKFLQNTNRVTEHTTEEVRSALDPILPHVHLQIAQSLAAHIVSARGSENAEIVSKFQYHIKESKDCDLISSRLMVATYLLQHDRFEECELSLLQCVTDLRPFVTIICRCHDYALSENYQILLDKYCRENVSIHDFRRQCVTGCMVFLPSQACLVHPALRYEMFRSALTQPNSRNASTQNWFDWIVVDSNVYLFFLLYVLYSKTNKQALKRISLLSLLDLIKDPHLGHIDTFSNLLGWIFFHENKIQEALPFLYHSWRFRPNHNAAKWHLAMFCYMYYKSNTR